MSSNLYTFPPVKSSKLNIPDDEAIYRITGKGFFDGATLIQEYDDMGRPNLIAYDGEPNFNLIPMNELALMAVEDWMKKLDEGVEIAKKHPEFAGQGGYQTGVNMQAIQLREYINRIKDSGRFDTKRIEPAVMSNKVNKATARVIDQSQVETPEIKSVKAKKQDQTEMVNSRG